MIRTIAALAALVAIPSIAGAQEITTVHDIVVYGHSNVYRIVVSTAGKTDREVKHDIAKAALEACSKVNDDSLATGSVEGMDTCVERARDDATRQYDENKTDWYREVGYGYTTRFPIDADPAD